MTTDMWAVLIAVIFIHMIAFLIIGFQVINLLEEIAFPSDDPIMTSTLDGFTDIDEEEGLNIDPNHGHDLDHIAEVEKEIEEEETAFVTVNQLRRMKKDELIGLCDSMGLDTDGTKNDLVDRISKNQ
tara:strand:- start:1000 stop:1380 length:381 start_codon:yes stop_codon:yes gene_type:complete